jgi:hypothetical protein
MATRSLAGGVIVLGFSFRHVEQAHVVVGHPAGVQVVVQLDAHAGGVGWRGNRPALLLPGGVQAARSTRCGVLVADVRPAAVVKAGADDPAPAAAVGVQLAAHIGVQIVLEAGNDDDLC